MNNRTSLSPAGVNSPSIRPLPEFGPEFEVEVWPSGRHWLLKDGKPLGFAERDTHTTRWRAHGRSGAELKVSLRATRTGTYRTRKDALTEVAASHQRVTEQRRGQWAR